MFKLSNAALHNKYLDTTSFCYLYFLCAHIFQNIKSAESCFLPEDEKQELLQRLFKAYEMILSTSF